MATRAVLLDLYYTIVDHDFRGLMTAWASRLDVDEETVTASFEATRPRHQIGATGGVLDDMREIAIAVSAPANDGLSADLEHILRENQTASVHLFPDVLPFLNTLRATGVRTCLVSNCSADTEFVVERLALRESFDAIVLSSQLGARKPDALVFETALERLGGVAPSDALFVDDYAAYLDGAEDVGLRTALIRRPSAAPPGGFGLNARGHAEIQGLADLLPLTN